MTNNTNETKSQEVKAVTPVLKRDFILNENVTEASVKDIITGILAVNKHDAKKSKEDPNYTPEPITLVVGTYGGSVYDGLGIVSAIDSSETPVHTYCYSKAMSMGFIIFASGHKRFAHPLATFMYHQIILGTHNDLTGLEYSVEQSHVLQDTIDNYILATTNVPFHKMKEYKSIRKDWYIPATEAFNYNLVDELLVSKRKR
ncbi:ATP-dependent ClpP protease [Bacillus phage vB_BanS-Thrax5]|nr:ATP-dependent ClpP protease [Bacillus phage vB_BanS-Thrax5]